MGAEDGYSDSFSCIKILRKCIAVALFEEIRKPEISKELMEQH